MELEDFFGDKLIKNAYNPIFGLRSKMMIFFIGGQLLTRENLHIQVF